MKTLTFEVYNDDGSVSYETTKVVELPVFETAEQFSEFLSTAFDDTLPPAPEVICLI